MRLTEAAQPLAAQSVNPAAEFGICPEPSEEIGTVTVEHRAAGQTPLQRKRIAKIAVAAMDGTADVHVTGCMTDVYYLSFNHRILFLVKCSGSRSAVIPRA